MGVVSASIVLWQVSKRGAFIKVLPSDLQVTLLSNGHINDATEGKKKIMLMYRNEGTFDNLLYMFFSFYCFHFLAASFFLSLFDFIFLSSSNRPSLQSGYHAPSVLGRS
jgi:hypothetical protein